MSYSLAVVSLLYHRATSITLQKVNSPSYTIFIMPLYNHIIFSIPLYVGYLFQTIDVTQ